MNIVDAIIILVLLMGAVLGFKRGAIKTLVSFIGLVIALVLAFFLKNPVSTFMYEHLPFFDFGGVFKGVSVLNILLYEVLAYFLVLSILFIGVRLLSFVANIIEKALDFTIVLGIPSRIIGIFVGFVETYIYVFIILYVLALPMFNIGILNESTLKNRILNNTPILSNTVGGTLDAFVDVYDLSKKYDTSSKNEFNQEALEVLLKYNITTVDSIDKLIEKEKITINNIDSILDKYR
ncbi:MAG: CvpA family protein [Bacilli bacterium]|nr:CvpA family protein [Bacilli bacterium]